jgi:glycosyltransferase involved in cell wall biosynthesis
VIPAKDEGSDIDPVLMRISEDVTLDFECLVVVDDEDDSTAKFMKDKWQKDDRFRVVINRGQRGPSWAIRAGVDAAQSPVVVVTMADGSDDPRAIDSLTKLVERGVVVAAASRYMPGGQQVGASGLKGRLSRWAGKSLAAFAKVGTKDATNSFKAYDVSFVREVGIESRHGFEIGLELTAKAHRLGKPVAEIPTIWLERDVGKSNFKLKEWLPHYLAWYALAFGRPVNQTELAKQTAKWQRRKSRLMKDA